MITFVNYNANFKNKKTCDCVVRSLATASGKDYKQVAQELFNIWMKTGYMITEKKCYEKWLEENGFAKQKQPRKLDNTKYLIGEIRKVTNCKIVIISCAHHLTCVKGDELYDLWDCRRKTIGNYYTLIKE